MKYGVLVVTPVSSEKDRSFVNLGDMIQTEAILYVYERMGIKREDVIRIDINELNHYNGEYLILPININLSLNWIIDVFPLPERIIPVFLGLSYFAAQEFPQKLKDYFRRYEPIGCRDEFTLEVMRKNQIEAYLFGCITAVLPQRSANMEGNKVFFVDVPRSFIDFSKDYFEMVNEHVEVISHIRNGIEFYDSTYIEKETQDLLERYKKEAKLVVTSRLHCMSPCMAMGISVIPVTDNISPRMGWVDRYLNIYTPETYERIEWKGQKVSYETIKEKMIQVAIGRIDNVKEKYEKIADLSFFYETREKSSYGNYYRNILKKMPDERKETLEYILWGAGQIGMNAYRVISSAYPNSKLKAVVDSYCTGDFFGVPIEKPDILKGSTKEYIFITTTSGELCAREMMDKLGKEEVRDYLSMATTSG